MPLLSSLLPFLRPIALYAFVALAGAVTGYWYGRYDELEDSAALAERERVTHVDALIAANRRVAAAENAADKARREWYAEVARIKKSNATFSKWYDTPVPDVAVDLIFRLPDVPAATDGRSVTRPSD